MDVFALSRNWFNFSFENPELISIEAINRKIIYDCRDYSLGGFYLIKNTKQNIIYVGKSKNYLHRIRQHLYLSNKKTAIDMAIKVASDDFEFYLLARYKDIGINFFNRKYETIIEHRFISLAFEKGYKMYNNRHYGHL